MKINQKLYVIADGKEPVDTQKFDDREIQIFFMDQFEGLVQEYVHAKGQFAVWSSLDAVNYRLFIERGYYEEVKELYQQPVNQIWVEFWDTTDAITKKFTRFFIYPMMALAIVLCIISFVLPRACGWSNEVGSIFSYVVIGVLVALFVVMIVTNSMTKKKITKENIKSREKVIAIFGEETFNATIDKQKNYMDDYFKKLYPEDEEEFNSEEKPEEETPALENEQKEDSEEATDEKEVTEEVTEENALETPVEEVKEETPVAEEALVSEAEEKEEISE
ncbi:MAG: hypothetical protein K6B64_03575 [Acholeplasmatales bacterium]|nr:hypothetical protein [Acholeplasmatales bacterium]